MDMKMNAETITSTAHPMWDVNVTDGIVPIITDEEENLQQATIAAFLIYGSVPQLATAGVPWTAYLTQGITFGEIDSYVRQSIIDSGHEDYAPNYVIADDKLTITVGKVEAITE